MLKITGIVLLCLALVMVLLKMSFRRPSVITSVDQGFRYNFLKSNKPFVYAAILAVVGLALIAW